MAVVAEKDKHRPHGSRAEPESGRRKIALACRRAIRIIRPTSDGTAAVHRMRA
jgi:hypothetical protein